MVCDYIAGMMTSMWFTGLKRYMSHIHGLTGNREEKVVYSDDIIEEVRGRSDIVDVISGYVRLTRKGSSYFGLCPFHNEK